MEKPRIHHLESQMPFYTYVCQDCRRKFDVFLTYSEYGQKAVACKFCQSQNVKRAINRVRMLRSDENRMESMADPASLEGLDEDPRALGKMMREMSKQVGEEMPPEFDDVVDRLEKGQSPEEIEKEVPGLGDETGAGSMDADDSL
jgi:putative FmdB family regulatory protein